MGIPWKKILSGTQSAANLANMFGLPFGGQVLQAVHIIEAVPGLKGPQKKEAALILVAQLVGDDGLLTKDPELQALVSRLIDDYVAVQNHLAGKRGAGQPPDGL